MGNEEKRVDTRIIRTANVNWKKLEFLQMDNFKELTKASYEKLKTSILHNDFCQPFYVWESKNKLFCLDGVHRIKIMKELEKQGIKIPAELPANFIRCKDRKEAVKLILVYSAIYANVTEEGLYEFINVEKLNFDDLKTEIDLPKINLDRFENGYAPGSSGGENTEVQMECPKCGYKWNE